MLRVGPTICDSRDGSCPHGCTPETGCSGAEMRRIAPDYILEQAQRLIEEAKRHGVVLTIETEPRQPLAMGSYDMVASVRRARGET